MWCMKCNKHVSECICPDIKERLASANAHPNIIIRICLKCGEHYSRCKCKEPQWNIVPPEEG